MSKILSRISAPLLVGSILSLGALAWPGAAGAQDAQRFVFRGSSGLLPFRVAAVPDDGEAGGEEPPPPDYAPANDLAFRSVELEEFAAVEFSNLPIAGRIRAQLLNEGEMPVSDAVLSVDLGPWGEKSGSCTGNLSGTSEIMPGGMAVCDIAFAVADNDDILALGIAPGGTVDFNAVASLASLGSGLIDPEDDSCSDADCREEGVSASVVSSGDAAPVLELCEQVFDPVALPVDVLVVLEWDLPASA